MYGESLYSESLYSGELGPVTLFLNLTETLTPADTVTKTATMFLADVVGPQDGIYMSPLHSPLEDTLTLNDWLRIERRPSNSKFQGA